MTVNQDTRELLDALEVGQIAAYLREQRMGDSMFDIALNAQVPNGADPHRFVRTYEEAGATWWVELPPDASEPPPKYQERIRRGPPRGRP